MSCLNEKWTKYILLDVLLCSIAEYFYELCRILAILHNKTSNKRFIIQHAKLLCPWGKTSRIFIYEGMRDRSMRRGTKLAREIQLTDWSTAGNLSNRSSGVQIPRDICTRFGRYLYSTRCSWIIKHFTSVVYFQPMPEESLTENQFEDATIGMNIPKNFIPSIEKVMMSMLTLCYRARPKTTRGIFLETSFSNYGAQLTGGTTYLKN